MTRPNLDGHLPPAGQCMCGTDLDNDGDCQRCDLGGLEYAECRTCNAILNEDGLCWYCSPWIWRPA